MEEKKTNQPEVTSKPTEEQREPIEQATDKLINELKVGTIEERHNPSTFLLDG